MGTAVLWQEEENVFLFCFGLSVTWRARVMHVHRDSRDSTWLQERLQGTSENSNCLYSQITKATEFLVQGC